jgi:tetratricopeptide (TPR) repeat protein
LIIAAAIWAYHNSFQAPFIFDDVLAITRDPRIRHLWPIWDVLSTPTRAFVGGRPIVSFSLALNYALGGFAVQGYHTFNLAIHILAALTLYGIVRRTLARPVLRQRFGASGEWIALAVALLWTVHPLQTEAVTYISQRCESLMGLFYLLTLYGFIRGTDSPRASGWFALSVAACFLGMASKELMVTAPVLVLLYDRTFVSGSFREAWARHWRPFLGLATSWLLLGCLMAGLHIRGAGYGLGIPWWGYALSECRAIVQYLRLALWPHPLILDYGEYAPTDSLAAVAPDALILAALAIAVLYALKRHPAIGFLGAWFFVILAPTSSVVPIAGSPMAEHRMYLPLAAVIAMVVIDAFALGRRLLSHQQGVVVASVGGATIMGLFTFLTFQRNRDYNSPVTIWRNTVDKCPDSPRAHGSLGFALQEQGRLPEATEQYELALRLKPDQAQTHYNLGNALLQAGKVQDAIRHYQQALRIKPDLADIYNLATALEQAGGVQQAIQHYEEVLRIKPNYAEARNNLGVALHQQGKTREAAEQFEQALRINPDYAEAHNNLGNALRELGRPQEAIRHYEQALRINPDYAEAHNNLGNALRELGRPQEAIRHYEEALRIRPDDARAHWNLGNVLIQVGRQAEAIQHYQQALRIKPDFAQAQNALARARASQ